MSPIQQVQGFNPRDPLAALADLPFANYEALRQQYRDQAREALKFAAVNIKYTYDRKHKPLRLKVSDWAILRLHRGYRIPGHLNRKLDIQRTTPLKIIRKVGKNTYKLELPSNLRIHPIVSVAQLEPLPKGSDPFGRMIEARQAPVEAADEEYPLYEIERLMGRRIDKRTRKPEYLVRWLGWGSVHNC